MTVAARNVLDDCKFILSKLEDETDDQPWRIRWVAVITLLRTFGHVLTKVDGQSVSVRLASDELFRVWKSNDPADEIFREFIEKERNSVIREYASGISEGPVPIVIGFANPGNRSTNYAAGSWSCRRRCDCNDTDPRHR